MVEICRFWYDSYTVSEGLVVVTEFLQPANSGIFFTAVLQHFHSTMSSPPFTAFPAFKDIDIAPMANPFPLLVVLLHLATMVVNHSKLKCLVVIFGGDNRAIVNIST